MAIAPPPKRSPVASSKRVLPKTKRKVKTTAKANSVSKKILAEIEVRRQKMLAEGRNATQWAAFASMVNIQTSGTVKPFEAYDYQIDAIEEIERSKNVVICKSRQMGLSEMICCYLLMRAITEPGFSAVVFSKTQDDASELGRRVRDMAVSLGKFCPKMPSESAKKIAFKGLGRIHLLPVTARAARGIPSVSVVVFDEAAFIDSIDGVYQAAVPTLSMLGDRGKVIFNSTPNGRTGLFYRLLAAGANEQKLLKEHIKDINKIHTPDGDAQNNIVQFRREKHTRYWERNNWTKILLHWRVHPIYGADPNWAQKTRIDRQLTEAQWNQEYELDFAEGHTSVFSHDLIDRASRGEWSGKPKFFRRYVAGVDPSFGSSDYFTVRMWDITEYPYRLVNQYRANYKTHDYNIEKAIAILEHFQPEMVSIETNGGGEIIHQELVSKLKNMNIIPLRTSNQSKLAQTDKLVLMLERDQLVFPAKQTKEIPSSEEYKHFVERINGASRYREAESGWHDDTVMADAIALHDVETLSVFDARDLLNTLS